MKAKEWQLPKNLGIYIWLVGALALGVMGWIAHSVTGSREALSAPAAATPTDLPTVESYTDAPTAPPYPPQETPAPVVTYSPPQETPTPQPEGATVRWAVIPPLVPGPREVLLICYENPCVRIQILCGSELLCRLEGEGGQ